MSDLLSLYQKHCRYQINDNVQKLDFNFDVDKIRTEIFKFITDNKFGFSAVSLRLPINETNYDASTESLESSAINPYGYHKDNTPTYYANNKEYNIWHPTLVNSYTASIVPEIEKYCGLNIGRIRLAWLQSNAGYCMHADLEPMRLHIPLFTNKLAYIIHGDNLYHMQYGNLYHLITTNIHTAYNFGSLPRLHLVFSTYADDDVDTKIQLLTRVELGQTNFLDQIKNQGVDHFSLSQLFNITNSIPTLSSDSKIQSLKDIQKIIEILDKN